MSELAPHEKRILECVAGSKPWFSICAIGVACDSLGIKKYRDHKNYQWLALLHCVDFKDMTPELRADVDRMIAELLTLPIPKRRLAVRIYQAVRALIWK